jgi:hypothetical protein
LRERCEIRGRKLEAKSHVSTVADEDVPYRTGRVVDGEDRETAAEERMGRIGDLDLGRFLLGWVIEVGIKLMARSTT